MRLTHAITMQDPNRANLEVTVLPDGDALPITLEQDGGAGEPDVQTVYLSFEQFDVMAELVQRARPAAAETGGTLIPEVAYAVCGHRARFGTCVMAGRLHARHINALGQDVEDGATL